MKKILTITLLVLLTVGLFVSCNANAVETVSNEKIKESSARIVPQEVSVEEGEIVIGEGEAKEPVTLAVGGGIEQTLTNEQVGAVAEKINNLQKNETITSFKNTNLENAVKLEKTEVLDEVLDSLKKEASDVTAKANIEGKSASDISLSLNIKLSKIDVESSSDLTITSMEFEVTPIATITVKNSESKDEVVTTAVTNLLEKPIKFRLPVDPSVTDTIMAIYHEGAFLGNFEIKTEGNEKYVEIESQKFSKYGYQIVNEKNAGAKIGDTLYFKFEDAVAAVKDNDIIILNKPANPADDIVIGKAVTFKVDKNGKEYTDRIKAADGYKLTSETKEDVITYFTKPKTSTFKAVYNTKDGANTLTFYYDDVDHKGDNSNITVYDNLPTAATVKTDWGYDSNRANIKGIVIDSSVAEYDGITSTAYMFRGMENTGSISGTEYLDTSNVTDMTDMFNGCKALAELDLSNFNTASATTTGMFNDCSNLISVKIAKNEDIATALGNGWTYDNDAYARWGVTGSIESKGFNWDKDVVMTETETNVFVSPAITLTTSDEFKIRLGGDWAKNYGTSDSITLGEAVTVVQDGANMKVLADGNYIITLNLNNNTITVTKDEKYTVTFDLNGITGTAPTAQTVAVNGKVAKPEFKAPEGYALAGWYKEAACTNAWDLDSDIVTKDTTLYAKWNEKPFVFTAVEAGASVKLIKYNNPSAIALVYSTDGVNFQDYSFTGNDGKTIALANVGDKVYFRAKDSNEAFYTSYGNYYYFVLGNKKMSCEGNIMYLLDSTGESSTVPEKAFMNLFKDCDKLTSAPLLPAMNLGTQCYANMFQGCTLLTTAPVLPAKTLAESCYYQMFDGCSNLNSATILATDVSAEQCLKNWLNNVAATGTLYVASEMEETLDNDTYRPSGWNVVEVITTVVFKKQVNQDNITINRDNSANIQYVDDYTVDYTETMSFGGYKFYKDQECTPIESFEDLLELDSIFYHLASGWYECHKVQAPTEYTVTFDLNGITGTAPEPQKVVSGGKVTNYNPTGADHAFVGWYKTKDGSTGKLSDPWTFTSGVTEDLTLYAQWTRTIGSILGPTPAIPKSVSEVPPANAWVNGSGCIAFLDDAGENFIIQKGQTSIALDISDQFIKVGNNYVNQPDSYGELTFIMTEGVVTSVYFDGTGTAYSELNGTYTAPAAPTFKAVYNTKDSANTLTFYYDNKDHSGENITVYENDTDNYLFDNSKSNGVKWGYNSIRSNVKSVVIDSSVADYDGLTSTAFMFYGMKKAESIDGAENLDVSNVKDMSYVFAQYGSSSEKLNAVPDVSKWDTAKVTDVTSMFNLYGSGSLALNVVPDVSNWDTSEVTLMSAVFQQYGEASEKLNEVPNVSGWKTLKVTNMEGMFQKYGKSSPEFNAVPNVSNWDTSKVENMMSMFNEYGTSSTCLTVAPNVSNWNTGAVTNMSAMFQKYGSNSETLNAVPDVIGWDTGKVDKTSSMFEQYGSSSTALTSVPDVSNWNTSKVTNISRMFLGYGSSSTALEFVLDLSNWNVESVIADSNMFDTDETIDDAGKKAKEWSVTIPAKTGDTPNEPTKWYYGDGTNTLKYIEPATNQEFIPAAPFSVSNDKKVNFTKGNLYWDGDSFEFETKQYEYPTTRADHVGHFFYHKIAEIAYSTYDGDSNIKTDILFTNATETTAKSNFTVAGVTGKYRSLSKAEWEYLLNTRTASTINSKANARYVKIGINTGTTIVYGLLIFPDEFAWTESMGTVPASNIINRSNITDWVGSAPVYTISQFTAMETAGCVFIPAAGQWFNAMSDAGSTGLIWTSTPNSGDGGNKKEAYCLNFDASTVEVSVYVSNNRSKGYSIRLVKDVPAQE